MKYKNITSGIFISRPNRFTATVNIDGETQTVHVKNTGRCRELLIPGARIFLEKSSSEKRKTQYDLIFVYKGDVLVNMDSQAPNKAAGEWLRSGGLIPCPGIVKPEVRFGESRLDFYVCGDSGAAYAEVKGVTLEEQGAALFPDAPTERGCRHLNELVRAREQGFRAAAIFVVQMQGCRSFSPNERRDPLFARALKQAAEHGVEIIALDCVVTPNEMVIDKRIEVRL